MTVDRENASLAPGGPGAPDGSLPWLTRLLLENPDVLQEAAAIAGAGDDHAYVQARQMIGRYLREASGWPRGADYGMMAHELGNALLWKVAGTDALLAEDRAARGSRYAARPVTDRERILASVLDGELIDFDPDGPVTGIDGSVYRPGHIGEDEGNRTGFAGFVIVAEGTGMGELIATFSGYEPQRRWLADRGHTAVGELTEPELGLSSPPRLVLEERVLAGLLACPRAFGEISFALPPDSFTADARYEIYAAMIALAQDGRRWYADDVATELGRRLGMPQDSSGSPWVLTYLRRLRQAQTDPDATYQASRKITMEDSCARMRPGQLEAIRNRIRQSAHHRPPEAVTWYAQRCAAAPVLEPDRSPRLPRGPAPNL
jgi:DnaB-like helicase N terminal domain